MKILAVADIHGFTSVLPVMSQHFQKADLIILTGDITDFGRERAAQQIISKFRKFERKIIAVPGNCDYPDVSHYLDQERINIEGSLKTIEGVTFAGLGGSLPCPGLTPYEFTEKELARKLDSIYVRTPKDSPIVFVSHQPPLNTLNDKLKTGEHVGSKNVRRFIEVCQPLICFTGHIHEGAGIDTIGTTRIVNPGPLRTGRFAWAEIDTAVKILEIRTI